MKAELADLLPHRPPMVMIDAVVKCGAHCARATKRFTEGSYGLDGDHVTEPALIECLAQTVAAMHACNARRSGRPPGQGLLVGVSDFEFHCRAERDVELELTVKITKRLGPLCRATGSITQGGRVVAEGSLKFYIEEVRCETKEMPPAQG